MSTPWSDSSVRPQPVRIPKVSVITRADAFLSMHHLYQDRRRALAHRSRVLLSPELNHRLVADEPLDRELKSIARLRVPLLQRGVERLFVQQPDAGHLSDGTLVNDPEPRPVALLARDLGGDTAIRKACGGQCQVSADNRRALISEGKLSTHCHQVG